MEFAQPVNACTTPFDLGPLACIITAVAALQLLQVTHAHAVPCMRITAVHAWMALAGTPPTKCPWVASRVG